VGQLSVVRYRMESHPARGITLIHGDTVPTFQKSKVKFQLIRAAKKQEKG
jgi:hypothetical protein